ncbi:MAG: multicopper oxidase family protein [Alphaproteobacteria bacterium]|nr:multicopper oxidase family protein [Alphaproteobacteria bacterium]
MIPLALLGCTGPGPTPATPVDTDTDTEVPSPTPTADTAAPAPEAPTLLSPAEALDLDPAPDVLHVSLVAAPHTWDGVDGYAYNNQVPGPTLRARVGDTLVVDLDNQLGMPTSIHWHGVDVPFAMDGAGWQVSPVGAGETFTYTFTLEQAGTFWYHPHFDTEHQVDLGLYGVLIVEDPAEPVVDSELVVVFDGPAEVAASEEDPTVDPTPTTWLVNGLREPAWRPNAGETVRVRMLNASNAGYVALDDVRVIARDRGLLGAPDAAVVLAPGDRAELEWAVDATPLAVDAVPWSLAGPTVNPAVPLFTVEPVGASEAPEPVAWPFSPAGPTADPGHTDLRYTFTGSAAAGWEINGQTWPAIAPDVVSLGSEIILEIRNPSPAHHPFHLHGMAFEVLSIDGVPPAQRLTEDTLDIGVQETVRLRIEADNPGDWMIHCHILPHAEDGMMTVFSVQ